MELRGRLQGCEFKVRRRLGGGRHQGDKGDDHHVFSGPRRHGEGGQPDEEALPVIRKEEGQPGEESQEEG